MNAQHLPVSAEANTATDAPVPDRPPLAERVLDGMGRVVEELRVLKAIVDSDVPTDAVVQGPERLTREQRIELGRQVAALAATAAAAAAIKYGPTVTRAAIGAARGLRDRRRQS